MISILLCCFAINQGLTDSAVLLGHGSGVVINHNGEKMILTAKHVIVDYEHEVKRKIIKGGKEQVVTHKEFAKVRMATRTNTKRADHYQSATVVALAGEGVDLALLRPDNAEILLTVDVLSEDKRTKEGEPCWYCGLGCGVRFNLVKTIVNDSDDNGDLRVNGEGWFGHSGSGVIVRRKGKYVVAGIVCRPCTNDLKSPVLCVSHREIHKFLKGLKP